jgi:tyrosine-protein kinase Etk/Wzc
MRAQTYASPDEIDITVLWAAVRRALPRLLVLCMLAGIVTFGVLSLVAPRYESEAQLAIVGKGTANPYSDPSRAPTTQQSVSVRMDKEAINTHVRALLSPDLAEKIADEMKLAERVEFNRALGPPDSLSAILGMIGIGGSRPGESDQDRVLSAYFKRLDVYSPKESRFIGVRFYSNDAELAASIANKIAETYRESLTNQTIDETDAVQKAIEPKIAKLTEEVQAAEAKVERFRGKANIFKGSQKSANLNDQQLSEISAELSKVKAARSEAEARMASAREMQKIGVADAMPDVQKSPLIQNLVQQRVRAQRQVSELSATLLSGHPRMRQLRADLAGLKRQINREVAKMVSSLAKEAKVAALREESLTKSLNELKARIVTTAPDEVKLRGLEAAAKSKRAELERLQAQFEANRVRADSGAIPVEAQIITTARPSSVKAFPKKGPYMMLVMVAVFIFGLAIVVTRALLQGARPAFAEQAFATAGRTRATPAGSAAQAGASASANAAKLEAAITDAMNQRAEGRVVKLTSISAIAERLDRAKARDGVGLRSLIAGETETLDPGVDALELARTLSGKARSVIVIDWSPSGKGIAASTKESGKPGMNDIVEGTTKFSGVITTFGGSDVHFIPAGKARSPALGEPDPDRINVILDALDEVYDHIVVAARHKAAQDLFEAIQGRFDAGIIVSDRKRRVDVVDDAPDTFLGFEVDDIDLICFERPDVRPKPTDRISRVVKQDDAELRA